MSEEGGNQVNTAAAAGLVPSQAINSNSKRRNNNRPRQRKPKTKEPPANGNTNANANANDNADADANADAQGKTNGNADKDDTNANSKSNNNKSNANDTRKPKAKKPKNKKPNANAKDKKDDDDDNINTTTTTTTTSTTSTSTNPQESSNNKKLNADAKEWKDKDETTNNTTNHPKPKKTKPKPKPKKKKSNANRFPWRSFIPPNTVDPISLEPLDALPYPPFALTITPPHDPIPEWPVPVPKLETKSKHDGRTGNSKVVEDPEKRQEQLISEQWGDSIPRMKPKEKEHNDGTETSLVPIPAPVPVPISVPAVEKERHYHLFDGRVLAVYLVSTLQFIDPLNRRDLTRDEIKNLDLYLATHRLKKMRVLEAYDEKGISLSSAGVGAQTQGGRLRIRQEEARNLLESLFGGHGNGSGHGSGHGSGQQQQQQDQQGNRSRPRGGERRNGNDRNGAVGNTNAMGQQNAGGETNQQSQQSYFANDNSHWNDDGGIYGHSDSGMIIIDDDANPGLRGGLNNAVRHNRNSARRNNATAPHDQMASLYGHRARVHADNFPALSSANANPDASATSSVPNSSTGTSQPDKANAKPVAVSKSLSKIGNFVEKRNPKQVEKQRKARELAMRKAEIASMTYEEADKLMEMGNDDPSRNQMSSTSNGLLTVPTSGSTIEPTEGQLLRNRNFASALGVAPSTMRTNLNSGWARLTTIPKDIDEFGNELNMTQYPDALIIEARERMPQLMRLEKKWIAFLKDDKAASCPLQPMDKPARKFVHEYSDFWNLHTQSFDPQPNRYIHCVKLLETRAPRPFLSEAVRTWRGPAAPIFFVPEKFPASPEQPAGQDTLSSAREFSQTEERAPLKLVPRSIAGGLVPPPGAMFDMADVAIAVPAASVKGPASASQEPAARFAPMLAERERPMLKLDARTKPLEIPKYQPPPTVNAAEMAYNNDLSRNTVAARKRIEEEKKKSVLAAAFASDDEDSGSDSEWEVGEAVFSGSDDEE